MVEDTPDDQAHTLMPTVIWPDQAIGQPILGREETVSAMDQAGLKAYLQANYSPDRMVISAVGRLDHDQLVELVKPAFGAVEARPGRAERHAPEFKRGDLIREKPLEQVHLCLGLPAVSVADEDRYAAALINIILGGSMSSRLFQEIREKRGLAYSVYSYLPTYSDAGLTGVYLGVEPGRAKEALAVCLEVMADLAANPVDGSELNRAKEQLKGQIFLAAESTDNRMNRLARNEYHYGRYVTYDELADRINRVSVEETAQVAARILDPTDLALVALGPGVEDTFGQGWYRK